MCDVGFGIEAAAAQYRLGFIPLVRERYYLACRTEVAGGKPVKSLIAALKSPEFEALVKGLAGYDWTGVGELMNAEGALGTRAGGGGRIVLQPEAKPTRAR